MIYRGHGFLVAVWFGSYPTFSPISKLGREWEKQKICLGGGGGGRGGGKGAKTYDDEKALSSIAFNILWIKQTASFQLYLQPLLICCVYLPLSATICTYINLPTSCLEAEFMNVQFRWGFWHNLESSQTWVFHIQCLHYNPLSNHFCSRGRGLR